MEWVSGWDRERRGKIVQAGEDLIEGRNGIGATENAQGDVRGRVWSNPIFIARPVTSVVSRGDAVSVMKLGSNRPHFLS